MAFKIGLPWFLRVSSLALKIAGAIIMLTNKEEKLFTSCSFEAKFNYWSAFWFFVVANLIASVYDFLTLWIPAGSNLWRGVVVLDWVTSTLLVAAIATATNSYKELETGVPQAGWYRQCCIVPHFCKSVVIAVLCSSAGCVITIVILLTSFYTMLSSTCPAD